MYSHISSIRNGFRSSSLISLLARNHASRAFSSKFDESPNYDSRPSSNAPSRMSSESRGRVMSALSSTVSNEVPYYGQRNFPSGGVGRFRPMDFVADDVRGDASRGPPPRAESRVDFVHVKLLRNNSFVSVTDSKGNKKFGFSNGSLPDKAGRKASRYSAEGAAEHVGRMCRNLGIKSVVIKVNGHIHFKKKKQAIMSWMEGYSNIWTDEAPVVCIEDTTRKPHNGCRRPRARRS